MINRMGIIALGKPCIRGRELSTTISFGHICCMSRSTYLPCSFCSSASSVPTAGNPNFRESCIWNNVLRILGTPSPSLYNHHVDASLARGGFALFLIVYSRHFVSTRHKHRKKILRKFGFGDSTPLLPFQAVLEVTTKAAVLKSCSAHQFLPFSALLLIPIE